MVDLCLRIILVCIIVLSFGVPQSADAQSRRSITAAVNTNTPTLCKPTKTKSSVKLATSKTKIVRNQSANSLTALHGAAHGANVTLGLAGGPVDITMKGRFSIRTKGNTSCVNLEQLEVLFWAKPVVFIASNFKKGSCEYNAVLNHEQKHIRTLRNFVKDFAPDLKREVKNILNTEETKIVVQKGREGAAQRQIENTLLRRLEPFQEQMLAILDARQTTIDSPKEYARVRAQCKNWGRKIAQSD